MDVLAPGIVIHFAPRRQPAAGLTGWYVCQSNGTAAGRWHFFIRTRGRAICGTALAIERSEEPGAYTEHLTAVDRGGAAPVCGSCDRMRRAAEGGA